MFEKFFTTYPEYEIVGKPSDGVLNKYKSSVPEDLLFLWEHYGFGVFANGYLKLVNPDDYQDFMMQSYSIFHGPAVVFAATAFGDLLIWEREWVTQIVYRFGNTETGGSSIAKFFNVQLTRWSLGAKMLRAEQFTEAREKLGPPAFDECYGYFPALALGGSEKVKNIQKVDLKTHLDLLSQIVGRIED